MLRVALLVRLHALRGREEELAAFLQAGLPLVHAEHETPLWLALRFGPCSFGIFDAFSNDDARQAHLAGRLAAALFARAPELLAAPPQVEMVDILASKLVALTPPTA